METKTKVINIDAELHNVVRIAAAVQEKGIAEICEKAILEYLKNMHDPMVDNFIEKAMLHNAAAATVLEIQKLRDKFKKE
jgi:hypothetical protein